MKKTVIINRAVPGSGKTTITNCIVDELEKSKLQVAIHSTDEYFMQDGKYIFDIENLKKYHENNLTSFQKSLDDKVDVIICDNTNIAPWQTESYTQLARDNYYQILIITLNPRALEKHVESQKVTEKKPDAHAVSEDILKKMIREYYIYDDLLNQNIIIDSQKHLHYEWNEKKAEKKIIGVAKHFDSDFIIRILPDEYKYIQSIVGNKILKLIEG